MPLKQTTGSRAQVMHGTARKTTGGLTKSQLKYNKQGKIVSRKASTLAKKNNRLVKAGYSTTKGVFGSKKMKGGLSTTSIFKNISSIQDYPYIEYLLDSSSSWENGQLDIYETEHGLNIKILDQTRSIQKVIIDEPIETLIKKKYKTLKNKVLAAGQFKRPNRYTIKTTAKELEISIINKGDLPSIREVVRTVNQNLINDTMVNNTMVYNIGYPTDGIELKSIEPSPNTSLNRS